MKTRIRLGAFGRGRLRVARLRRLLAIFHARDYAGLARLVTSDFRHVDAVGNTVVGPEAYVQATRNWVGSMPDVVIEVDEIGYATGALYADGRVRSESANFAYPTKWRIVFSGTKLKEMHALRERNSIPLARMAF